MKKITLCLLNVLALINSVSAQSDTTARKLWQPYRISPRTGAQHIDLSGNGWELSYADQPVKDVKQARKDAFQTTVPNSVHWSYYKAGKLPHPYYHKNSTQYRWIEEKAWYYKKSVTIPASAQGSLLFLCFDGVDYFSKVWVNDSLVGVHEGMFGGPSVEISRYVKAGQANDITVEVRAGNWGNKAPDYENLPRNSNGEFVTSKRTGFNPRASGRVIKPWVISGGSGGEAFFTVGMWQGVRLEIVPAFHLERPYLITQSVTSGKADLHLSAEVFANAHSLQQQLHPWNNTQINHPNEKGTIFKPVGEKLSVLVELISAKNTVFSKEYPLTIYEGRNWFEQDLALPNPKLWQPNGLGEPNLYTVRLTLKRTGKPTDALQFDYGIRSIERVATAGPRTADRWENWQCVVNGRKIFVKGMNFTPQDILLDLPKERYRWTLEAAKKMGVQLIRIWGGGLLESDYLYEICDELGIMVWQDFPIGNQDTPDYPQDIWEAQVVQNIVRLRNHPSLAIWCGGNEFNPYSSGNAKSMGILERNLDIFDKSVATAARLFVRTTPDDGAMHAYPDMDPTWYNRSYKFEPWVSETGMHSIPEASLFYETVDNKEFTGLGKMWETSFGPAHPEFIHHFTEYGPSRVPRMLSRASHISDMADPTIESISEASQIGAGEFYQVLSEKMQGNYPVTSGLMPWVFKRHWPVIAIQMMDWFGNAGAPYYFLKRTYEPTHIAIDLPRLLWKPGERISLPVKVTHALPQAIPGTRVSVRIFDDTFNQLWQQERPLNVTAGTSVSDLKLDEYTIPANYRDRFLFILAELRDASGKLLSRSFYFPRSLSMLEDNAFYQKYISEPIAWPALDKGPFLKSAVGQTTTTLTVSTLANASTAKDQSHLRVKVTNTGKVPAFMTNVDIVGTKRAIVASDNYTWLAPGESQEFTLDVIWREPETRPKATLSVGAWNAAVTTAKLSL
ncbi:glycoside hydrolase family 2 protein [Spirosoma endbachense]|uniref:Beta-mannosidase B n=1 Tax=Spirosoma endbachense TaxID=2666025 RepID=A0A6P1VS09_9BACT|nr:sugar-binding domain-containing protein [Spirosoma endbachense]QHV94146.1 beta-mannosidase [Spirosoma endbachense]